MIWYGIAPWGLPPSFPFFTLHRHPNPNPKIILWGRLLGNSESKNNGQNDELGLDLFPGTRVFKRLFFGVGG